MKIRVTTDKHEYQGVYKDSIHYVEDMYMDMRGWVYIIKINGRLWKFIGGEGVELLHEECRSSYCECEEGKCSGGKVDMRADEAEKLKKKDMVNSPSHYALFDDIEAIQVIASSMTKEMFKGYCFGNLLKYKLRAGGKDDIQQELKKADKYKELYEKYQHLCKQN